MNLALLVLALVTLQRGAELVLARRNTRALLARGGMEWAPGHYSMIVLVHAAWLAGLWIFGREAVVNPGWLTLFVMLQALRVWIIKTLGPRWTTRIIILPGVEPVRHGPYRFISHPNYAVVVGEIAVLPLAFGLPWFAVLFTLLNAAVLVIRIRAENRALNHALAASPSRGPDR
jgi:methyltransferase